MVTSETMRKRKERGKELEPARKRGFELWEQNPSLTPAELRDILLSEGHKGILAHTCSSWLERWRHGKGYAKVEEPVIEEAPVTPINWEQIIKAVPNVETLSALVFQGLMFELDRRSSAFETLKQENVKQQDTINNLKYELEQVTREKNKVIREFNEKLARVKTGTMTLDQVQHRIFRKE